jgi:hypothetical protein
MWKADVVAGDLRRPARSSSGVDCMPPLDDDQRVEHRHITAS